MSLPSEYMVDRRKLRRKLGYWRMGAIAAGCVSLVFAATKIDGGDANDTLKPHIARLTIDGVIVGDKDTLDLIRKVGESKQARAVILKINSPGGTTTGAEQIYDEVRRLNEKKPVVAVVGTLAASGGYIAALGAERIVAHGNSLVGSIGVLFQYPNVSKLLDNIGVKVEEIKSSPLKAAPNGLEPTSEAARAAINALVVDSFVWFKDLVKTRRKLDDADLAKISDGRVFTGRMGVPLKLVDMLGGETEAVQWLETDKNVEKKLPLRDWKKKSSIERLGLFETAAWAAGALGYESLAGALRRTATFEETGRLDGLMAIWQGFSAK